MTRVLLGMVPMFIGFIVLAVFLLTLGCGGPPAGVQRTLTVTAQGLLAADGPLTERYRSAADDCYAQAQTRSAYNTCIAAWDTAVDALSTSGHALRMAQLGHAAWAQGSDERSLMAAVPCLASALIELLAALDAVGVPIPEALSEATSMVQPMAEGACSDGLR